MSNDVDSDALKRFHDGDVIVARGQRDDRTVKYTFNIAPYNPNRFSKPKRHRKYEALAQAISKLADDQELHVIVANRSDAQSISTALRSPAYRDLFTAKLITLRTIPNNDGTFTMCIANRRPGQYIVGQHEEKD